MTAFRERFAHDVRHAEDTLVGEGGIAPLFILTTDRGIVPLVPAFGSQELKDASLTAARLLCIAEDPMMVMHRCEAWLVVGDLSEGVRPSQSDRRAEVVIVMLAGRVGGRVRKLSSVREIVRGPDGMPTGLADVRLPGGPGAADLGGPMSDILPERQPTAEQRRVARFGLEKLGMLKPA